MSNEPDGRRAMRTMRKAARPLLKKYYIRAAAPNKGWRDFLLLVLSSFTKHNFTQSKNHDSPQPGRQRRRAQQLAAGGLQPAE